MVVALVATMAAVVALAGCPAEEPMDEGMMMPPPEEIPPIDEPMPEDVEVEEPAEDEMDEAEEPADEAEEHAEEAEELEPIEE